MKILCVLGEHNYGDPSRGGGYEYVNFLPAIRNLGHEVVFFESYNKATYSDFADLNKTLLNEVHQQDPDVIFFVLFGYEVWLETLQLLRKKSRAVLINWATDDSWKYDQFSRFFAPYFDIYVTTYPDALTQATKEGRVNVVLSQWAASSDALQEPLPSKECKCDVSFVGTAYGNRPKWIAQLASKGIPVSCYGKGWPNGSVSSEEMLSVIRESRITLNFGDSGIVFRGMIPTKSRQIKARIFEVPGAGGFLMTEDAERLENFFKIGDEIAVFSDIQELSVQIRQLLAEPKRRDSMANAAYLKVKAAHTYEARFSSLFANAVAIAKVRLASTLNADDMQAFDRLMFRHRSVGTVLRWSRAAMVATFSCFLGARRGERAARRILFEVSWRLVGAKTYSAMGLPGRLFYRAS